MAKQIINDELAQELFQKYCEGVTITDLQKQYGISQNTIKSAFNRRGLHRSKDVKPQKPKQQTICSECPKDCKYLMTLHGKYGTKMYLHCGYILFDENGSRGCDPGAGCIRYEPRKRRK
jgi:hypothetical protein